MDPIVTSSLAVLSKLIGLGLRSWDAFRSSSLTEKDLLALQSLIDAGTATASLTSAAGPSSAEQAAIVVAAFGRAFERHWAFTREFAPSGLRRFFNGDVEKRASEIQLRLRLAGPLMKVSAIGDGPFLSAQARAIDSVVGSPLHTPYYRALWNAFSNPDLVIETLGDEAPLQMENTTRREFERHFLAAYLDALDSQVGRPIQTQLANLNVLRRRLVQELVLEDTVGWGSRHVFGNRTRHDWSEADLLPFMPLEKMYVQPRGQIDGEPGQDRPAPEPVLQLMENLLDHSQSPILIVKADFGCGKSLTARSLACRWAAQWLSNATVSLDSKLPVFIRCVQDFSGETFDLNTVVRRAWKRQLANYGLAYPASHTALNPPDGEQRTVFILDGLDEVGLGERALDVLLTTLRDEATDRHQFVLFSRPGALPSPERLQDIPIVSLLPFDSFAISEWLRRWNAIAQPSMTPIEFDDLQTSGLAGVAQTPILLLMVAEGWERHRARSRPPSRAVLYEDFFQHVARGKHKADRDPNPTVQNAALRLHNQLKRKGLLADDSVDVSDAMLWLMASVAWEAHKLAQQDPPLAMTRHHVEWLVEKELGMPPDVAAIVEVGLLLTLQADLRGGADGMLFGHQSFREFLVARHWAFWLRRIAAGRERDWPDCQSRLMGARLLGGEDQGFEFLMEIVNGDNESGDRPTSLIWNDHLRERLVDWAQACFDDEQQEFADSRATNFTLDRRAPLREAALAIGSLTRGSPGLKASRPGTLRSLLAWFWVNGQHAVLIAPHADFSGAFLDDCDLSGARLEDSILDGANLIGANLDSAILERASLRWSQLRDASLRAARLAGACISGGNLDRARLHGAGFERADLTNASMIECRLDEARFNESSLAGARLDGAVVRLACFDGARFDERTVWPDSEFDPVSVGARPLFNGEVPQ